MQPVERLESWVVQYTERLVRLAYAYERDQAAAEDRVQEAFICAFGSMKQLVSDNPFPWLARIVINQCRMAHRRTWREVVTSVVPERLVSSTEDAYLRESEADTVQKAVLSLPEKYRLPIVMFHFEELSVQNISDILDINGQTVKTRLARGRRLLRAVLKEEETNESGRETTDCKTSIS